MIKNITSIKYKVARYPNAAFSELSLSASCGSVQITEEETDAGIVYNYSISARLKDEAIFSREGLILEISFLENKLMVGSKEFPLKLKSSDNLNGCAVSCEYKTTIPPEYLSL